MGNILKFKGILIDVNYNSREVTIRQPDGLPLTLEWLQGTEIEFIFAKFRMNELVEVTFEFGIGITHIE